MGKTLYKHTHFVALSIFAGLMLVAGGAIGLMAEPGKSAIPVDEETLGRFVVTPKHLHFVPPAQVAKSNR